MPHTNQLHTVINDTCTHEDAQTLSLNCGHIHSPRREGYRIESIRACGVQLCIHTCVHNHTIICARTQAYTLIQSYRRTHTYTLMLSYGRTHRHTHIHTPTRRRAYTGVHTHAIICTHPGVYVWTLTHMQKETHTGSTRMSMHAHTDTHTNTAIPPDSSH